MGLLPSPRAFPGRRICLIAIEIEPTGVRVSACFGRRLAPMMGLLRLGDQLFPMVVPPEDHLIHEGLEAFAVR
jgi:hypothetical protein